MGRLIVLALVAFWIIRASLATQLDYAAQMALLPDPHDPRQRRSAVVRVLITYAVEWAKAMLGLLVLWFVLTRLGWW